MVVKVINHLGRTIPSSELENSVEMSHPRSKGNRYFKVVLMQQYSLRFHLKNRLSGEMYQVFFVLWEHYFPNIAHLPLLSPAQGVWKWSSEIVATLCFQYHKGTLLPQSNKQINKTIARRRRRRRGRTWTLISKAPSNIPFSLFRSILTAHLKNWRI